MTGDILDSFSPATSAWFRSNFEAPTAAQAGAWQSISAGRHSLVIAPTGSGKTLAAFLWALDHLATTPAQGQRCRVLYISPLKALAVDVERNLRSPLVGIQHAATRLGLPAAEVTVAVRSGDTPAAQRRDFVRSPADILITTPESLFLLLTSAARESLRGIETVIIDEVHAVAGTKRGAHLALSLERLDALLTAPAQRIGLSATVRPAEAVANFLGGGRPVEIVAPGSTKQWQLDVVVPVPDLTELGAPTGDLSGAAAGEAERSSIWPHVERSIAELVQHHHSTIVFANSRRLAERLTARINEIHADQGGTLPDPGVRTPAEMMAQSGGSAGAPAVLARAHHGSVSREQRVEIEEDLKAGRLPAVVATSSLELGIDMGAVDLVVQVESPPSVASGLQRVGRAGHQVGAISRGVLFPKFRGDLVPTAVIVERMRAGAIEELRLPSNPLDVLAQQIVAMVAMETWTVPELATLVRRAAPFATLSDGVLSSVLDMLAGRYPSEEFGELRPRLVWDRLAGTLTGRRSAQRLAVTSGGTIPDRGLYGVFLAGSEGPGRRVGELDEEMVYESRVGDVFALGTSSWRIVEITHDQVLVLPAPGVPARLPFWKGDTLGRPAELGRAIGEFLADVSSLPAEAAQARVAAAGLDEWASDNLLGYLADQQQAISQLPTHRRIVVERFADELGDWQLVVHSPWGSPVHAPWSLLVAARLRERFGVDVQAMHADDGMVFRLPDVDWAAEGGGWEADILEALLLDPSEVMAAVTEQLGGSALFASRFRECAGRALLLPNRRPGRRQALWQQRQRSSQLLQVASNYPDFPIVLEAVRECVNDVFDVPALQEVLSGIRSRRIAVTTVATPRPSPFAGSLVFGYVAQFLYEGDSPLAERRAAALALDPELLADLLGTSEGMELADLLDPEALTRTERDLQHLSEDRRARDADDLSDILRTLGPLSEQQLAARSGAPDSVSEWLAALTQNRRVLAVRIAGESRWAAVEDAGRLRDALGINLPQGIPDAFTEVTSDPLGDLAIRYARSHAPFTGAELANWLGLGQAVVKEVLTRLTAAGRLSTGDLRPLGWQPVAAPSPTEDEHRHWCDPRVLSLLRRRSLAALRHAVEPVTPAAFARFLPAWQGLGSLGGVEGVARAVDALAGLPLPASAWESLILPARVHDYHPAMLDELTAAGEVLWQGHGALGSGDGWVSLHPADLAPETLAVPDLIEGDLTTRIAALLGGGGASFFRPLADGLGVTDDQAVAAALWELVWAGLISNDTIAPLRGLLAGGGTAHRSRPSTSRSRIRGGRALPRPAMPRRTGPPQVAGRWSLLPEREDEPTARATTLAGLLLDRYGVVTRGSVTAERIPGGFAAVYRVLAAAEEAGRVRRGYFVERLGAAQFAEAGAVDRLRAESRTELDGGDWAAPTLPEAVVLAACDPANPYGAALSWPPRPGSHQPSRKAGALVVTLAGELVLYVERGGRTLLSWSESPDVLARAATALAAAVHSGALGPLTVAKVDGEQALGAANPLAEALAQAGFRLTPSGLRLRR